MLLALVNLEGFQVITLYLTAIKNEKKNFTFTYP